MRGSHTRQISIGRAKCVLGLLLLLLLLQTPCDRLALTRARRGIRRIPSKRSARRNLSRTT